MRILTAFLALCVGTSPLFAASPLIGATNSPMCAMTGKTHCVCCAPAEGIMRVPVAADTGAGCKCAVSPGSALPESAPRNVVRAAEFAAVPVVTTPAPVPFVVYTRIAPLCGVPPPLRRLDRVPDAGRAPPSL